MNDGDDDYDVLIIIIIILKDKTRYMLCAFDRMQMKFVQYQ